MIVPGGGISLDRERWVACRPNFFLPVRVLSRLFRRLVLESIDAAHRAGRLQFFGKHVALTNARSTHDSPSEEQSQRPICFSPYLYRARNRVERVTRIKQCRRVATRYDKLAANHLTFVSLRQSGCGCGLMSPRPKTSCFQQEERPMAGPILPANDTERHLAYCESEQGCVLVIETSGTTYGSMRDIDRVKFLTAQTKAQMGTRNQKVNPNVKKDFTG
jgi:transposase